MCVCQSDKRTETYDMGGAWTLHICVSIHHNKGTFRQKGCTLGGCGRYVNAQAFSFVERTTNLKHAGIIIMVLLKNSESLVIIYDTGI